MLLLLVGCFLLKADHENEEGSNGGLNIYFCSCCISSMRKQPFKKRLIFITRGTLSTSELKLRNEDKFIGFIEGCPAIFCHT